MFKAVKTFPTATRRFHPGMEVTEADMDSPDHFARMRELGYIEVVEDDTTTTTTTTTSS